MKSYDVVGYVSQGDVICPICAKGLEQTTLEPIFASEEWDYIPCCYDCGDEIDVNLVEDE